MDYAIPIFLNLVFLGIFYFLFSIRIGQVLEKSRKQGIPREFYENVELVVRYLDTALESITQKNEAFYRLLNRSEAVKKELEALLAEYEKPSTSRKKNRKTATKTDVPPVAESPEDPQIRNQRAPNDSAASDRTVDRLLRDSGEDRIEWSSATLPGELSDLIGAKKNRPSPGSAARAETVFSGVGRFARRLLGLSPLPGLSTNTEELDRERKTGEAFPRELPESGAPRQRKTFEEELTGYAPVTKPPYPGRMGVIVDSTVPPEPAPPDTPQETADPEPPVEQIRTAQHAESRNRMSDLEVPDLTNARERATFIRTLLLREVSAEEIAVMTGIAAGEIEFVRKVMENQSGRSNRGRGR